MIVIKQRIKSKGIKSSSLSMNRNRYTRNKSLSAEYGEPRRYRYLPTLLILLSLTLLSVLIFFPEMDEAVRFWKPIQKEYFSPSVAYDYWKEQIAGDRRQEVGVRSEELGVEREHKPKSPSPEEMAELAKLERKEKDYKSPEGQSDEERLAKIREKFRTQYALAHSKFEELKKDVANQIQQSDFATAGNMITTFTKSEHYIEGLMKWDVEKMRNNIRIARLEYEKKLREQGELALKTAIDTSQKLVAEDKFDEAIATLKPFQSYLLDSIKQRATNVITEIEKQKQDLPTKTAPARRDVYSRVFLKYRPLFARRDYSTAIKECRMRNAGLGIEERITRDEIGRLEKIEALFADVTENFSLIPQDTVITIKQKDGTIATGKFRNVEHETINIAVSSGIVSVPVRTLSADDILKMLHPETQPLTVAEFLLHDEEFVLTAGHIANALAEGSDVDDLVSRLELIYNVVIDEDVNSAIAQAREFQADREYENAIEVLAKVSERYKINPTDTGTVPALQKLQDAEKEATALAIRNISPETAKYIKQLTEGTTDEKTSALRSLERSKDRVALPYIVKSLSDESIRVKVTAADTLATYGDKMPYIIDALLKLLDEKIVDVALMAVDAMKLLDIDKDILTRRLTAEDEDTRRLAVVALGVLGDEKSAPYLRPLLKDKDARVRKMAAVSLLKLGDRMGGSDIFSAFKVEEDIEVKSGLAVVLGKLKMTFAEDELIKFVEGNGANPYRRDVIRALGAMESKTVGWHLLKLARNEEDEWTRYYILEAVDRSGAEVKVDDVGWALRDSLYITRAKVVEILAKNDDTKSLNAVVGGLSDEEDVVRATAAEQLMNWRERDVLPAIVKSLATFNGDGYARAINVLEQLTGEKTGTDDKASAVKKWEKWWRENKGTFQLKKR
ncbi:MAG: hypothetical protein A2W23_09940 [Planctomycetes bacterium RBG_16_43_13]|nr:MAG: hypothetical protein A2W23_09940 [Planctomycetes bacterium RBG_16_43_13]